MKATIISHGAIKCRERVPAPSCGPLPVACDSHCPSIYSAILSAAYKMLPTEEEQRRSKGLSDLHPEVSAVPHEAVASGNNQNVCRTSWSVAQGRQKQITVWTSCWVVYLRIGNYFGLGTGRSTTTTRIMSSMDVAVRGSFLASSPF